MCVLTEEEQAKIDALPKEHGPTVYKVRIYLQRRRNDQDGRMWTGYVRATSERRAKMAGHLYFKATGYWMYRRKGLRIFGVDARIADPVADLGMTPSPSELRKSA